MAVPERSRIAPTVAELLEQPELGLRLEPGPAASLLAQLEGAAAVLRVAASRPEASRSGDLRPDRLLTVETVAERMGMTPKQVYARAAGWSFAVRPSKGTLRFSERG